MVNIWFTSDTHYGHKNIVRGTSEWGKEEGGIHSLQRTRNFNTIEEHNQVLVDSINGLVKENDILYHLGDWSFGGHPNIKEFRERLNCKNIHLVFGNHDQHIEPINSPYRELFSSCEYYKELNLKIDCTKTGKYGKQLFVLSHYAMRVWNKSHRGSIMLYGHSHGTLDAMKPEFANPTWIGDDYFIKNYRTMDVGMDTNNLYPYHLDEILDRMKARTVEMEVDHHTINTN